MVSPSRCVQMMTQRFRSLFWKYCRFAVLRCSHSQGRRVPASAAILSYRMTKGGLRRSYVLYPTHLSGELGSSSGSALTTLRWNCPMSDQPYILLEKYQTTTGRTLVVYPKSNSSWLLKVHSSCCDRGYVLSTSDTTSFCSCGGDKISNEHGWGSSVDIYACALSSRNWSLWIKFWFGLENAEFTEF